MYKIILFALLGLISSHFAVATPSLFTNLAYRSPSTTVSHSGLAHDIDAITHKIIKRDGRADSYEGNLEFPYGVASGDPLKDSAIIWTHPEPASDTNAPLCLNYQTSTNKNKWDSNNIVDKGNVSTTKDIDYSVKVETKNLKPRTMYYYRFTACHDSKIVSPVGRFRTTPQADDDSVDSLNIAVFSCSNLPHGYFNAYRHQASKDNIDYVLHVGDYIYESGASTGAKSGRQMVPDHEIVTLDDYRQRYKAYRKQDEGLRELHARWSWLPVWDDHEVADNAWKNGTADSNDTLAGTVRGVRFTERKKNAVKAYFEWMPIRQVDTQDTLRIWRKFEFGKFADLILLDTRQYDRDITDVYYNTLEVQKLANDTNRSLMGGKQEHWLYDNLIKSKATWKIISQQIVVNHLEQLSHTTNLDAWDGYLANRRRLFNTISENHIDNTVLLAGDSHAAWVFDSVPDNGTYDSETGQGAIGVEFAGTAVSSPSSYGSSLVPQQFIEQAKQLVKNNRNLQFAEGDLRGYFSIAFTKDDATATYFGMKDNDDANTDEVPIVTFNVKAGANKLTRPINGGKKTDYGALQNQVVKYNSQ